MLKYLRFFSLSPFLNSSLEFIKHRSTTTTRTKIKKQKKITWNEEKNKMKYKFSNYMEKMLVG